MGKEVQVAKTASAKALRWEELGLCQLEAGCGWCLVKGRGRKEYGKRLEVQVGARNLFQEQKKCLESFKHLPIPNPQRLSLKEITRT